MERTRTHSSATVRAVSAVSAVLVATSLLSACGSSAKKGDALPIPSASPSATADPTGDATKQILTAYNGMWTEEVKAYSTGSLSGVNLEQYSFDKALANIKAAAVYYQDRNEVMKGQPVLSPKVTALDLTSNPNRATIQDCVDSANFIPVDKTTGQPAQLADPSHPRHMNTFSARVYDGRWVISDSSIDRDHEC